MTRRQTRVLATLALAALVAAVAVTSASGAVSGSNVLYTTDADFDEGTLVNVNHDAPNNNRLQLNTGSGTFPFIWVALSVRCTIAKIDTSTGEILGEYRTISDEASSGCNQSSRTTVSLDGSVWVGHRGPGGVNHVGLAELNQCRDRNNNGTIETSTGYGDVLAWPGTDSNAANAADECILHHLNDATLGFTSGFSDSRHMSIDAANNLWVGSYNDGGQFVRVDGATGTVETPVKTIGCGGYGGLIDEDGVIWSANGGSAALLRWDPDAPDSATNPRCISTPSGVYGLAIDPSGSIWFNELGSQVAKVTPDGNTFTGPFPNGQGSSQGLAVDSNGDVWTSSSLFCSSDCTVGHLKNDGTLVGNVPTPTGAGSTGVAVDAAGKIWTANLNSNTATRIDPAAGPLGCGGTGCGDDTHVGAVDLTVEFPEGPDGRPLPSPYNYSDMTGAQLLGTTPQGTWTVVQDGNAAGARWGQIAWNTEAQGSVPAGASITVEARAADTEAGLGGQSFVAVTNGASFNLTGRFIQVRVTLRPNSSGASPVLSDIRIQTNRAGRMVGKGAINGTTGGTASYAYIVRCDSAANANAPFEVRFGAQRFRLTSTSSVSCANDPAVTTPSIGFDTQVGSGAGTLTSGGPGTIEWRFVDAGTGAANDSAQITIRNSSGTIIFQGSAGPPGQFPSSTQPTGNNTAQAVPGGAT